MATLSSVKTDIGTLSSTDQASLFVWLYSFMTETNKQSFVDFEVDTVAGGTGDYITISVDEGPPLHGRRTIQPDTGE